MTGGSSDDSGAPGRGRTQGRLGTTVQGQEASRIRKARHVLREEGPAALAQRVAESVRGRAFQTSESIWFRRPLCGPAWTPCPRVPLEARCLVEDKARLLAWMRRQRHAFPWIYNEREVELAGSEPHVFVELRDRGEIVGHIKIGVGRTWVEDFERVVRVPSRDALIYDTFVLPSLRRKRAALFGLSRAIAYLREEGFERLWCHIEEWNVASLRLYETAGFERQGFVRYCRVLGVPFFVRDRRSPFLRLEAHLQRAGWGR